MRAIHRLHRIIFPLALASLAALWIVPPWQGVANARNQELMPVIPMGHSLLWTTPRIHQYPVSLEYKVRLDTDKLMAESIALLILAAALYSLIRLVAARVPAQQQYKPQVQRYVTPADLDAALERQRHSLVAGKN